VYEFISSRKSPCFCVCVCVCVCVFGGGGRSLLYNWLQSILVFSSFDIISSRQTLNWTASETPPPPWSVRPSYAIHCCHIIMPLECQDITETSITFTLLVFTKHRYMFRLHTKAIIKLNIMPRSWTTYLKFRDMLAEPALKYNDDKWSCQIIHKRCEPTGSDYRNVSFKNAHAARVTKGGQRQ
jgi:hypothetical protein